MFDFAAPKMKYDKYSMSYHLITQKKNKSNIDTAWIIEVLKY